MRAAQFSQFGGPEVLELVELTGSPDRVITIADSQGAEETGVPFSGGMGTGRAVHALSEIAEAHRISEDGHVRGKLVLLLA
jgi:hypothetical protein